MTGSAASVQIDANPGALAVSVSRTQDDSLSIAMRYSYEGRPPTLKKRAEMAKAMLREAVSRLESCEIVDVGFSEDSQRRVRTDRMEI
jgi:hypothetical protein